MPRRRTPEPEKLDYAAIGRRIREIRGFEMNQADFGHLIGVGQSQVSKYERGEILPPVEVLVRIAAAGGKTLDWISLGNSSRS